MSPDPITTTLRRNVELKARYPNLANAEQICHSLGAADQGLLIQRDTYFHVPHGRLKLRVINDTAAELIGYARSDSTETRSSDYRVVPIADPDLLRATLAAACGVKVEVRKRRRLFLWKNVRIHLDSVEGLGSFMEFEAVLSDEHDEPEGHAHLATLIEAFGIKAENRLAVSYEQLVGSH